MFHVSPLAERSSCKKNNWFNNLCVFKSSTAEIDSEELSWIQSSVDEVITMLQQSPGLPSIPEVSFSSL